MKPCILGLMAAFTLAGGLSAQKPELVRGETKVMRPEIADGLFLHNVFQSGMMLQRDKPIKVWGWAKAGAEVEVSLGATTLKTRAKSRDWSVTFEPLAACAKPITLKVNSAGDSVEHDNIIVGDIWVLGGQSNMEFPLSKVENGQLDILSANLPEIRMLTTPSTGAAKDKQNFVSHWSWSSWSGRHFRQGYWDVCSRESVADMSAIGFVFAKRLHEVTDVPIGLIDTSIGGTTIEAWTPLSAMRASKDPATLAMLAQWKSKVDEWDPEADLQNEIKKYENKLEKLKKEGKSTDQLKRPTEHRPGPREGNAHPGNLFSGVIAPLQGIQVKGALFHQGYNNCFQGSQGARMYADVMPIMVREWRKAFGDENLAFCILSLCTGGNKQDRTNYLQEMIDVGAYLRDAQYKTFLNLRQAGDENIGFVSTYDLSRRWYHPQLKYPAGERAARWALATQHGYSKILKWEPPSLVEMKAVDGALHLKFNNQVNNVDDGSYMKGFAIAGEDASFQMAKAEHLMTGKDDRNRPQYDRSVVVLTSPLVPKPIHFRYAWARNPMANVQLPGNTDVPLATLRSDDWDLEDLAQHEGEDTANSRQMRNKMKDEDLKRLKYEAQQLLHESK